MLQEAASRGEEFDQDEIQRRPTWWAQGAGAPMRRETRKNAVAAWLVHAGYSSNYQVGEAYEETGPWYKREAGIKHGSDAESGVELEGQSEPTAVEVEAEVDVECHDIEVNKASTGGVIRA